MITSVYLRPTVEIKPTHLSVDTCGNRPQVSIGFTHRVDTSFKDMLAAVLADLESVRTTGMTVAEFDALEKSQFDWLSEDPFYLCHKHYQETGVWLS